MINKYVNVKESTDRHRDVSLRSVSDISEHDTVSYCLSSDFSLCPLSDGVFTSHLARVNAAEAAAQTQEVSLHRRPSEGIAMKHNIDTKQNLLLSKGLNEMDNFAWQKQGKNSYKYAFHYIWENLIQGK